MNDPITVWAGAIVTFAVLTYLVKDNVFYRVAQKAALGVGVGILIVMTWEQMLYPSWWAKIEKGVFTDRIIRGNILTPDDPLTPDDLPTPIDPSTNLAAAGLDPLPLTSIEIDNGTTHSIDLSSATNIGDVLAAINASAANVTAGINKKQDGIDIVPKRERAPPKTLAVAEVGDGTTAKQLGILAAVEETPWTSALWLLALIPGLLWYCQMSKKWFYLSTPVIALFVGVAAGLAFKDKTLILIPQIGAALRPLNPWLLEGGMAQAYRMDNMLTVLNNAAFLAAMFTTLLYFCFTIKSESRLLRAPMKIGRLSIMIALGAMFGNTVMTRMAFLIERIQFLFQFFNEHILGKIGL
ncbi:hypothetical protein ACFL34_01320 [Candidatus Sumerlaeota bacterium]